MKQPNFLEQNEILFSKYSYLLCIFWYKKCLGLPPVYSNVTLKVILKKFPNMWLCVCVFTVILSIAFPINASPPLSLYSNAIQYMLNTCICCFCLWLCYKIFCINIRTSKTVLIVKKYIQQNFASKTLKMLYCWLVMMAVSNVYKKYNGFHAFR